MTNKDIEFIERKIKLKKDIILKLSELERDADLLLEHVIEKRITKKELNGLSFPFYCRIIIFIASKKYNFDISERSAVAKIVSELFPRLNNRTNFAPFIRKITPKPNEAGAKYYFVLNSLFYDKVNCKDPEEEKIKYISAGLSCVNSNLSKHVAEWISILREIKDNGKFRVNIMEEKIPELQSCPRITQGIKNVIND